MLFNINRHYFSRCIVLFGFFENYNVWLSRFIYFFPSGITQSLMQDPVSRNFMTS